MQRNIDVEEMVFVESRSVELITHITLRVRFGLRLPVLQHRLAVVPEGALYTPSRMHVVTLGCLPGQACNLRLIHGESQKKVDARTRVTKKSSTSVKDPRFDALHKSVHSSMVWGQAFKKTDLGVGHLIGEGPLVINVRTQTADGLG